MLKQNTPDFDITEVEKTLMVYDKAYAIGFEAGRKDVEKLIGLLKDIQNKVYHYPDLDAREYCAGCGKSPYNKPSHEPYCFVVRIDNILKEFKEKK